MVFRRRGSPDGGRFGECAVGPDVLPSPCIPMSIHSPLRFADSEDRGCGVLRNAMGVDLVLSSSFPLSLGSTAMRCSDSEVAGIGDSEGLANSSPMVITPLCSRSQSPPVPVCAGEQEIGMNGRGSTRPRPAMGCGGLLRRQVEPVSEIVEKDKGIYGGAFVSGSSFADGSSKDLPCLHSLLASAVDTPADGFVREELRVSPDDGVLRGHDLRWVVAASLHRRWAGVGECGEG
ncbi:hypothetical protein Dimus_015946 [Dionaea muscipula]